ncbi:hypothetical protein EJB05_17877, partial [Eragrostis curvula]
MPLRGRRRSGPRARLTVRNVARGTLANHVTRHVTPTYIAEPASTQPDPSRCLFSSPFPLPSLEGLASPRRDRDRPNPRRRPRRRSTRPLPRLRLKPRINLASVFSVPLCFGLLNKKKNSNKPLHLTDL